MSRKGSHQTSIGDISRRADAVERLITDAVDAWVPLPSGVDAALRRIDAHVVGALAHDVQTAIDHGWARPCDAQTIARYLLGGVQKLVIDALDPEQPIELDESVVREIGALVFFGLANLDLLERLAHTQRSPPTKRRRPMDHPATGEQRREESP